MVSKIAFINLFLLAYLAQSIYCRVSKGLDRKSIDKHDSGTEKRIEAFGAFITARRERIFVKSRTN